MKDLWIDVKIPFSTNGLAYAYNRGMRTTKAEWVLFLDHDLFICNPHWYEMCIHAIRQVGDQTGWITCVTNRIGNPGQKAPEPPTSNNIEDHILYARRLYKVFGNEVMRVKGALSGFFILTNKTAWKKAGGFNERRKRLLGVDNDYSRALSRAGYMHYSMPGLYFYHLYRQKQTFMKW